jgi:hypothetical protein
MDFQFLNTLEFQVQFLFQELTVDIGVSRNFVEGFNKFS